MRSDRKLTWQPQRTKNYPNHGRWRKLYKGRFYYFPGGDGRDDERAYKKALKAWQALKEELDNKDTSRRHLTDKALSWIVDQFVAVHPESMEIQADPESMEIQAA